MLIDYDEFAGMWKRIVIWGVTGLVLMIVLRPTAILPVTALLAGAANGAVCAIWLPATGGRHDKLALPLLDGFAKSVSGAPGNRVSP